MGYVLFMKKLKKCCVWFRTYKKQFVICDPELPNSIPVWATEKFKTYSNVLIIKDNISQWNKFSITVVSQSEIEKEIKNLKLVSAIFYQICICDQMIALHKLWKMLFISSKKLFLFSRYWNFCISLFPSFFHVIHCFRGCCPHCSFMKESYRKCAPKANPRPLLNFGK